MKNILKTALLYVNYCLIVFTLTSCEGIKIIKGFFPAREPHTLIIDTMQINKAKNERISVGIFFLRRLLLKQNSNLNSLMEDISQQKNPYSAKLHAQFYISKKQIVYDKIFIPEYIRQICVYVKNNEDIKSVSFIKILPKKTSQIMVQIIADKCFVIAK